MAYEVRPNTGSLFKNDKKEADSHPDYKGSGLIEGVGEVWLDAWINTSNNGTKYMALKFKRKEARQADTQQGGYSGSYHGDPRTNSSGGTTVGPQEDCPF